MDLLSKILDVLKWWRERMGTVKASILNAIDVAREAVKRWLDAIPTGSTLPQMQIAADDASGPAELQLIANEMQAVPALNINWERWAKVAAWLWSVVGKFMGGGMGAVVGG